MGLDDKQRGRHQRLACTSGRKINPVMCSSVFICSHSLLRLVPFSLHGSIRTCQNRKLFPVSKHGAVRSLQRASTTAVSGQKSGSWSRRPAASCLQSERQEPVPYSPIVRCVVTVEGVLSLWGLDVCANSCFRCLLELSHSHSGETTRAPPHLL